VGCKVKRKRITMGCKENFAESYTTEKEPLQQFNITDFFRLHEQSMTVKKLEGLAEKTITDHFTFMRYFKNWLVDEVMDYQDRIVEKGIFLEYIAYLFQKEYLDQLHIMQYIVFNRQIVVYYLLMA